MRVRQSKWHRQSGWSGDGDPAAQLVLYFGPADCIETARAPAELTARYPNAQVLGCSTEAAILGDDIEEGGIVAVACSFDHATCRLADADITGASGSARAGQQLSNALRGDGLVGAFVLADGVNVNGSAIASTMARSLGAGVPVSGGLAGDGARFIRTVVGAGATSGSGRAAAIGFYGASVRLVHAIGGGWDAFGPRRHITRSDGCVLHELDGMPALALYERYLGAEAAGLPGTALLFPLKVWDPAAPEQAQVRTVLSIDRASGAMTFAGEMPERWGAQLMRGHFDRLVDAAADAGQCVRSACTTAPGQDALALIVSCVGRRLLLGQRIEEEIHAVGEALGPAATRIGFYSHGEIAPTASAAATLQNQTMVLTLLTEAS